MLTTAVKPKGNLRRYEAGTIVELEIDNQVSYYLLGLSTFNTKLKAKTITADLVNSVQRLIEFCDDECQGYPVVLPLLGGGRSRTGLELSEILHYLVNAFAINKDKINSDFHIVVWEKQKDLVPINNL